MSRRLAVAVAKPSELAATEDPLDLATGALERLDALVADAGSGVQVATEVLKKLFADEADAEREAFAAAIAQSKVGPGDLVSVPGGTGVTLRRLAERLYGATVALPDPAREALDMRPGATFAAAARWLIVGWKRDSTGLGRMSRKEKTDGEREHC